LAAGRVGGHVTIYDIRNEWLVKRPLNAINMDISFVPLPEPVSNVSSETGEIPRAEGGGVVVMSDKYTVSGPSFTISSEELSVCSGLM
jgi:hypothetical protein